MKKILLILSILSFMIIPFGSAITLTDPSTWDDSVEFHQSGENGDYGYYEIADTTLWVFNKKVIKTVELIENDYSIYSAWNIKQIELFEDTKLFDETDYYAEDKETDKSNFITNEKHLYRKWIESSETLKVRTTCKEYNNLTNGTKVCLSWDTKDVVMDNSSWTNWEEYNWQILEAGIYQSNTIVNRRNQFTGVVDWIDTSEGHKLTEWATWWDMDWDYKREIEITADLGNFSYMNISHYTNIESDFDDVRFVDSDGTTEFNYTIEEKSNGNWALFRIANNGESTFDMYYGNSAVSTTSSVNDTYYNPESIYYFDSGATDATGTTNGSVTGATLNSSFGYVGGSYYFDGNDFITLANQFFTGSDDMTISLYTKSDGAQDIYTTLISPNTGSAVGPVIMQDFQTSDVQNFNWGDGASTWYGLSFGYNPDTTTTWKHLLVTKEGSTVIIYLDGSEVTRDESASVTYGGDSLYVGKSHFSNREFEGFIDEVKIWKHALSPTNAYKIYTSTEPTFTVGSEETSGTAPSVTLTSPSNNSELTSANVEFVTTVTDDIEVKNVSLYFDGILDQTNTSKVNGTYIFSKTVTEGYHNWSILAYDNQSLSNQSETWYFNYTQTPIMIEQNQPTDSQTFVSPPVTFNCSAKSEDGVTQLDLIVNGSTVDSVTNSTPSQNLSLEYSANYSESYYEWYCFAENLETNSTSSTRSFTVAYSTPTITLYTPNNASTSLDNNLPAIRQDLKSAAGSSIARNSS